ncbi:MAG: hypothetical protein LBI72_00160 [Flavobacteriaceae bacterium]|jgi:hypothetical protein|nr:hypothetical protein [Flavobacteriaceae bacterium]
MNRIGNSGNIRFLKKINENLLKNKADNQKTNNFSELISYLALIVSCISIYFQFFYEKHDIRANFISATFKNDTLIYNVVYHNKSNQDATILRNSLIFHQLKNEEIADAKSGFILFKRNSNEQIFNEEFDPIVLNLGTQLYKEIKQPFDFNTIYKDTLINIKDTLNISLAIGFINEYGNYSINYLDLGWVLLASLKQPKYYKFNYISKELLSETYRSSSFRTE